MRATAQDRDAARMLGIDVDRTIAFTFALGGALAGIGGFLYVMYFTTTRYDLGFQIGLFAFTAAVLGGIGNLAGAALGGLLIGLIQNFNEGLSWHAPGLGLDAVDRLLDPDPDPRLPPAGPARRVDGDARVSTSRAPPGRASRATGGSSAGSASLLGADHRLLPVDLLELARCAFQNSQWMPQLTTMVPVLVFVIMALGLNVVVGYAGLLDLGYVAFYAAGAYVAGWFASQQFAPHNVHFGAIDITPDTPGIHISPWLLILVGAALRRAARHHHRRADAASARRLPRDRDARLRRDHPAGRQEREQLLRLQRDERPGGPHRASTRWGSAQTTPRLVPVHTRGLHDPVQPGQVLLLVARRAAGVHALLHDPPARLAPRPRLGRDPRGRGRRRPRWASR